jgi:RNA polymerase sigma-70 factor (ECF subfamily)
MPTVEERFKAGDQSAFEELWSQHSGTFNAWTRRHTGCEHHTRDLLQDTAARLWAIRSQYDSNRPWRPWAFKILQNLVWDFHRRRSRSTEVSLDDVEPLRVPQPTNSDLASDLDDCLSQLDPQIHEVAVRRLLRGERGEAIAEALGSSVSSISRRWTQARGRLADCLRKKGHGERLR